MLLKAFQESFALLQSHSKNLSYLPYRTFARNIRKSKIEKPVLAPLETGEEIPNTFEPEEVVPDSDLSSIQQPKEKQVKDKILESQDAKLAEIQNLINTLEEEERQSHELDFPQRKKDEKETLKFIQKQLLYKGHDPFPNKLVQRPDKDAVWGLGGELLQRRNDFFEKGKMPSVDEIILYLEAQQIKDVDMFDFEELGRFDLPKYAIIGSGYSSRHIYKVANNLLKAVRDLQIPNVKIRDSKVGSRDDEWILVDFPNMGIHLLTQEARPEVDLENSWTNPVSEEEVYQREMYLRKLKRKDDIKPKQNFF